MCVSVCACCHEKCQLTRKLGTCGFPHTVRRRCAGWDFASDVLQPAEPEGLIFPFPESCTSANGHLSKDEGAMGEGLESCQSCHMGGGGGSRSLGEMGQHESQANRETRRLQAGNMRYARIKLRQDADGSGAKQG